MSASYCDGTAVMNDIDGSPLRLVGDPESCHAAKHVDFLSGQPYR